MDNNYITNFAAEEADQGNQLAAATGLFRLVFIMIAITAVACYYVCQ